MKEEDPTFDPTKKVLLFPFTFYIKDDKKGAKAPPAKKGGKDAPTNPLDAER